MPDKRPNILEPTLRYKRRYLAFQIISEGEIDFQDLSNAIWHAILNFLGENGTSHSRIWTLKNTYDPVKKIGLIRCSHDKVENVRAALSFVRGIGEKPVILRVIGVSGTIKAARKKFFGEVNLTAFV